MSKPGHDKKVHATFFFPEEPTIVVYAKVFEESGKGSVGWQAKVFAVRFQKDGLSGNAMCLKYSP